MKKILCIFLSLFVFLIQTPLAYAQKIFIPAGTPISVYAENEIDADDVETDENINFAVQDPVYVNGKIVIKAGTQVTGQVTKKRNNSVLGIPGEIQISNFKIKNGNNIINLRGSMINKGEDKYWVNLGWLFIFTIPFVFIKGDDGKISTGKYQILYTIGDNYVEKL